VACYCAMFLLVFAKEKRRVRKQASDGTQRYGEARGKQVSGLHLRRATLIFLIYHKVGR
jgi:hypothetical protein